MLVLYIVKQHKCFDEQETIKIQKQQNDLMLTKAMWVLRLKDTVITIKNKTIVLIYELRGFKFVIIKVLEFKKVEKDD